MAEILVVDDDRNFRGTLCDLLENAGYKVHTTANGREALASLQHNTPDLALCGWSMPDIGGEQLLRRLEAQGALLSMPVIIMAPGSVFSKR